VTAFTESIVEEAALAVLGRLGWAVLHGPEIAVGDGFARHLRDALPGASLIGFTGTPIELTDANTRSVFGDDISVDDIERSVRDGATVPIYRESRLAKLALAKAERPKIDHAFELGSGMPGGARAPRAATDGELGSDEDLLGC
jgi:hypothetical protein